MSIMPAHLMRSIGGGFDNECVAITALSLTFWLWSRSLRSTNSDDEALLYGLLTGIAYFYMVASWEFVLRRDLDHNQNVKDNAVIATHSLSNPPPILLIKCAGMILITMQVVNIISNVGILIFI